MPAFGLQGGGFATVIDRLLGLADRGGGLEGHPNHDLLAVADAPLDATGIVGGCVQGAIACG